MKSSTGQRPAALDGKHRPVSQHGQPVIAVGEPDRAGALGRLHLRVGAEPAALDACRTRRCAYFDGNVTHPTNHRRGCRPASAAAAAAAHGSRGSLDEMSAKVSDILTSGEVDQRGRRHVLEPARTHDVMDDPAAIVLPVHWLAYG